MNGPAGRAYFRSFGGTTSGLDTVSGTSVKALRLPLPPLDEQRATVRCYEVAGQMLDSERRSATALTSLKATLASTLLSGRLRAETSDMEAGE